MGAKFDLLASMTKKPARKPSAADEPAAAPPRGRQDKTNVTGYFPVAVKTQLRIIGAERSVTIQRQLAEALNDYFAKYHKPEIAPLEDEAR